MQKIEDKPMTEHRKQALAQLQDYVLQLSTMVNDMQDTFRGEEGNPLRNYTLDGRLVGDIAETYAALRYDIQLCAKQTTGYDAISPDGKKVQIKSTMQKKLVIPQQPTEEEKRADYYLGLHICGYKGIITEMYNGPMDILWAEVNRRGKAKNGKPRSTTGRFLMKLAEIRRINPDAPKLQKRKAETILSKLLT